MSLCILLFYFVSHVEHTGVSIFWLDWEELEINRFNGPGRSRMERLPQIRDLRMRNPDKRSSWPFDGVRVTVKMRLLGERYSEDHPGGPGCPISAGLSLTPRNIVSSAHAHCSHFGLQFQEQMNKNNTLVCLTHIILAQQINGFSAMVIS